MANHLTLVPPDEDVDRSIRSSLTSIRTGIIVLKQANAELACALDGLVAVFDGSNPYLPCEAGELPELDRARDVLARLA